MKETNRSVLAKNRAEELGVDVWKYFVIPRFYDRLDLATARKPTLIIGGRGCGKTMLLRYLSHQSTFSPARPSIPNEALKHIGLFWRADTQFSNLMQKREVAEDVWHSAFAHMSALLLSSEVVKSIASIANSTSEAVTIQDFESLNFAKLKAYDPELGDSSRSLIQSLEQRLWQFESWVNNVRSQEAPLFLPGDRFIKAVINEVREQIPALKESTYFVYLDEYENLSDLQQMIINTWLKHSETPLIFNLAMKRNAFRVKRTLGAESLADIHDYRTHDLEEYLSAEFDVFAAEVLLSNLSIDEVLELPMADRTLRDPERLAERKTEEYVRRTTSAAAALFPDASQSELAKEVFEDTALRQKLHERIRTALLWRKSNLSPQVFVREAIPEASIVSPVLLHRANLEPEIVSKEMDTLERNEPNRFTDSTAWIHNNFIGALLLLYGPHSRACPFYSGFRTFCRLSRGSLRHFLELCHKSIDQASADLGSIAWPIPKRLEAEAARQASTVFLGEIRSFGRLGNQLHTFVHRLGTLFELAQQRPSQSESERNHFAITSGRTQLKSEDFDFLEEAVKWSVLFEEPGTKKKDPNIPEGSEYILNPIYAPYFHISYRKKRRIDLSTDDLIVLIRGSVDAVKVMLSQFSREWGVEPAEVLPGLFEEIRG
jgi:hypothetical protein